MRTHTAEKLWFYSRDFRICSSFSARRLNVRAALSEFRIQYSCTIFCTYYTEHESSFIVYLHPSDLHSREPNSMLGMVERVNWACAVLGVFKVMRTHSVKHRKFSCRNFLCVMRMALMNAFQPLTILTCSAPNGERFARTDPAPIPVKIIAKRSGHKHYGDHTISQTHMKWKPAAEEIR